MSHPDDAAAAPTTVIVEEPLAETRPKRRRGRIALIVIVVLVILAVIAAIVAENIARSMATATIRERVVSALELPSEDGVDVEIGPGIFLVQALSGRVDAVDVDIRDVPIGDLTGRAAIEARGVPLSETETVDALDIEVTIPSTELLAAAQEFGEADTLDVRIEGQEVVSTTDIEFFGQSFTLGKTFAASTEGGRLVLTPVSFIIGDQTFDPSELSEGPLAAVADVLTHPHEVCVADRLPASISLDGVAFDDDRVTLSFDGAGSALSGAALQEKGSCD
ncbi:MAG: DUF2993 domain-containing protein [Microbacteriaceae bacterium]